MVFKSSRPKIFCIGFNKTGTTSLGYFLEQSGYKVAKQREGERLLPQYIDRDFKAIISYCKKSSSEVFQDVPFSLPNTFVHLDNAFPKSKFVLTLRDSADQWYRSILNFHSKIYNKGEWPTAESLKQSKYIYKGWSWDLMHNVFDTSAENMYSKNEFVEKYEKHIDHVRDYFKNKEDKLIEINLSETKDFSKLCDFLNLETEHTEFPRITSQDIASKNFECKFLK